MAERFQPAHWPYGYSCVVSVDGLSWKESWIEIRGQNEWLRSSGSELSAPQTLVDILESPAVIQSG